MKLVKYRLPDSSDAAVGRLKGDRVVPLDLARGPFHTLSDILEEKEPQKIVESLADEAAEAIPLADVVLLAPIDEQEVWAAGVTYIRSKTARMEESEAAASCYDRVYGSPRPELFFKATPYRVAGPGAPLRIRRDSEWNVPEPEVTLVINSHMELVGFTVGNDMSSRDIEGDNPLYLPQAKVYDACCGLGPCVTLAAAMPDREETGIELVVRRGGGVVFEAKTSAGQMARTYEELISWLGRETSFPNGVLLLTGTGIVPDSDFTLEPGDLIDITIDGIGTLSNPVVRGE
jgi:2-dehydro-3-deoxy-D-arabinonate dehydratase